MTMRLVSVALLAAAAVSLAACGGNGGGHDAQRAVDQINAGTAPSHVREFVERYGPVKSCHIAPRPEREDEMLLAVITKSEDWLMATIDPEQPVIGQDITTGGQLDPQALSTLRSEGDDCVVSLDYGTISLAAPPA